MVPIFDGSHLLGPATGAVDLLRGMDFIDQSFEKVFAPNKFLTAFVRIRMLHFVMEREGAGVDFCPPKLNSFLTLSCPTSLYL